MEVVLQARDAKDWVYKGEGAANLILSYTGSSPSMLGKVLWVKKILKDKAQPAPNCIVFSSYEQLLWGEIPELVESVKQDCLAQAYAIHVMSQHLGANHVDGGVRVRVSRDFLELVQKNVLSNRPAWRVNASAIDTNADSALLISDHSLFSAAPRRYSLPIPPPRRYSWTPSPRRSLLPSSPPPRRSLLPWSPPPRRSSRTPHSLELASTPLLPNAASTPHRRRLPCTPPPHNAVSISTGLPPLRSSSRHRRRLHVGLPTPASSPPRPAKSCEWTYNTIAVHLLKILESCTCEEYSAALLVLVSQLGRFFVDDFVYEPKALVR